MPEPKPKFYLTTPIYYVNARPHIGHAYTTIVADVLARRHRLLGDDTFFLTGTDEHGQKIERSAAAAGIPPQQFTDEVSAQFQTLWDRMGLTYNKFIRTTDPAHARGVQKLFTTLYERGFIYLSTYTGAYCVSDEAFVDLPVGTPCPDCSRLLEQVTEENFFFKLSEFQPPLLNLIESNELVIEPAAARNEVLSFLRGDFSDVLKEHYEKFLVEREQNNLEGNTDVSDALAWGRRNGRIGTTREGLFPYKIGALKDLSISRSSFTWGIPVPEAIQKAESTTQNHVIYVWLDALANYMTAVGYGSDSPEDKASFDKYWPADLHLVGKEITRFHCVYWPAFLLAADLPLPKKITANGWLLFDNAKMSKSRGNVVRTETILDAFGQLCPPVHTDDNVSLEEGTDRRGTASAVPSNSTEEGASAPEVRLPTAGERDLFATDVLRYFLLREIPFGQDGSFSFDAMVTRYNADLANGYGNLVSRVLNMLTLYRSGEIPLTTDNTIDERTKRFFDVFFSGTFGAARMSSDARLAARAGDSFGALIGSDLHQNRFAQALELLNWAISQTDQLLSELAPWKIAKLANNESKLLLSTVLYQASQAVWLITALLYPILPYATASVWRQLGLGDIEADAKAGKLKNLTWGGLQPGTKLGPLAPIFPRADKSLAETMVLMEEQNANRPAEPLKSAATPATHAPVAASTSDPAAPPRAFDSLAEPSGTLSVAGSDAHTTRTGPTPSHTEAHPSGPFASAASQAPITAQPTDAATQIAIDDFIKVELRIAEILVAERIPKADKLLRLEVSLGDALPPRQILSGIAEWYAPEDLVGRRIIVITNLAPRKMRGLESHGMLLAASTEGGKPHLATVPEGVPLGTRLK